MKWIREERKWNLHRVIVKSSEKQVENKKWFSINRENALNWISDFDFAFNQNLCNDSSEKVELMKNTQRF